MPRRPLFSRSGAPLTSSTFYVLLSLSTEDRSTGEVLEDIAMSSAGRVRITAGMLTARMNRLIGAGLVTQHNDRYRLTHEGRLQLADELERMERAVRFSRSRRGEKT